MVISETFSKEDLLSELRMHIEEDISDEDLQSCLSTITEVDENTYEITVINQKFKFDSEFCGVEEI